MTKPLLCSLIFCQGNKPSHFQVNSRHLPFRELARLPIIPNSREILAKLQELLQIKLELPELQPVLERHLAMIDKCLIHILCETLLTQQPELESILLALIPHSNMEQILWRLRKESSISESTLKGWQKSLQGMMETSRKSLELAN